MKNSIITIKNKGKNVNVPVKVTGFFSKGFGLMFRSRNTNNLLFEFNHNTNAAITSAFVFFTFLAIWLNSKNEVIETKMVRPFIFTLKPEKPFRKLVEIPFNKKNLNLIHFFVGKETFK